MKKLKLNVSCLCGGIKFVTKGNHRDVQNCHCIQCMKTHGHHAAYTNVEQQNIKFTKKSTLKWFRSSKRAKRGFCSNLLDDSLQGINPKTLFFILSFCLH